MADKTSTLVLAVNLSCCRCYMKIKKALSKFEEIQCLTFDEKENKVTISGQFDPEKLEMKLCCKTRYCIAGCVIKIEIVKPPTPPPPPPPPPPKPPQPLAITVNVIGIAFPPCYVPNVCHRRRPCRCQVICEDTKCRPPCVPIFSSPPKRCYGGCKEDEICSCSGYGSGSICSSTSSFW